MLDVLADLALGLLELHAQGRDVVHRPLELHEHDVRAGIRLGADLRSDTSGRRTAGRVITTVELLPERCANRCGARDPTEDARRVLDGE